MLLLIGSRWPFSGSDADEDADVAAGILVADGFIEDLRSGIVLPGAFVQEHRLADLDGFERETGRCGCSSGLPDGAVELWRWFFP